MTRSEATPLGGPGGSVFLDSNVVVYANGDPETRAGRLCRSILAAIIEGQLEARTSVAVIEEIWHLELRRRPALTVGIARDTYQLLSPVLAVTEEIVGRAFDLDMRGGSNDHVHAATCLTYGIDTIISADNDFDGVAGLQRIDPADSASVNALLRAAAN